MNRKVLTGVIATGVLLFLGAYFASPVLAARGLISAAKAGDEAKLERLVDFPAFRESLKEELNARLRAEMRADLSARDSALAGLGMMLAPSLIGGAVDALVTPSAVAAMVRTAEAPDPTDRTAADEPRGDDGGELRQSYGYRGLNTFAVTLSDPDSPERRLVLLMERRNLFAWRLAGVDLTEPTAR